MDLSVKLEVFEGPLDLLLHLLEKNKVNIYDIPIVEITNQYMAYIQEMKRRDLDIMSEFLVMAATLLDIKARWLLPAEETEDDAEEDPRTELVERLLQYKMFQYMSQELKDRQIDAAKHMFKSPTIPEEVSRYEAPVDMDALMDGVDLARLNSVFQSVMRKQIDKLDPIRSGFGNIEKEEISLEKKMAYLKTYLKEHRTCSFKSLLKRQDSKVELVVTFLAVLELMKMGVIKISQERTFGEITIAVREI